MNKKIIIVGASSGIGRELALLYAKKNCSVGITGRRKNLLDEIQQRFPANVFVQCFDNTTDDIEWNLSQLISKLGGCDLFILSSGVGYLNSHLDYALEKETIDLNVTAWTKISNFIFKLFERQQYGQLAAITSIASLRGEGRATAYNASKAFQSHYLEGLQKRALHLKLNITVTDIRPGFVKTKMAKGDHRFWEAPVEKAAHQIFHAIEARKKKVYITKRWWIIAQLLKYLPSFIYDRI